MPVAFDLPDALIGHDVALCITRGNSPKVILALFLAGPLDRVHDGSRLTPQTPRDLMARERYDIPTHEAIEGFRDGSIRCMIATSLADEGMDVPRASVLILATVGRSAAKLEQRTGRVMRPHESKTFGVVYDYADKGSKMAYYQHLARLKTYKALGYSINLNT
jgi:ATP-dependent helicase YprA (DUF1998 family)